MSRKRTNPYGNLLPLHAIRGEYPITLHSQIIHFFSPDREIFIPIGWSMDDSPSKEEIEVLKAIFPQYSSGPLWELYKAYDKKGDHKPIYQVAEDAKENFQWILLMRELCFFSFLTIPIVIGSRFYGSVTLFFTRPNIVAGKIVADYHLTEEIIDDLARLMEQFYGPKFTKLYWAFEANKYIGKEPIAALGQTWR